MDQSASNTSPSNNPCFSQEKKKIRVIIKEQRKVMKFKFVEFLNCKFIYNPNIHQEDEHILILWYGAYKELTKFIDKMTNRGYFVFTIDTTGKSFHI